MGEHVILESALSPVNEIQFHQGGPVSVTLWNGSNVEIFVVYSDATGLRISRSTDGGKTYAETTISATTGLIGQTVWYDRWTPGDTTGNLLHIAVSNPANEQVKYFSWNLSTHTAGSTTDVVIFTATTIVGSSTSPDGNTSICKGANGSLYIGTQTSNPSSTVYRSTDNGATWATTGAGILNTAIDDQFILIPCSTVDDIMVIKSIEASNIIQYRIWDDSASSWGGATTFCSNSGTGLIIEQKELFPNDFSATVDKTTGNIYFVYHETGGQLMFKKYTVSTATWGNERVISYDIVNRGCTIQRDQTNGMLVVYFLVITGSLTDVDTTTNILLTHSSDDGITWSNPKRIFANNFPLRYIAAPLIINNTNEGWYVTWTDFQNDQLLGIDYNSAINLSVPATLPYQLVTGNVRDKDRNPLQNAEVAVFKQSYNFRDIVHGGTYAYQGSARTDSNGDYKCLVMNWPDSDKKYQCIVKHGEAQNHITISANSLSTVTDTLYLQKFSNLVVGKQIHGIRVFVDTTEPPENFRIKTYTDVSGNPDSLLGESVSTFTSGSVRTVKFDSPITIPSSGIVWIGIEVEGSTLAFFMTEIVPTGNNKFVAHTYGTGPATITSPSDTTIGISMILFGDFVRMDATIGELKD